MYYRIIEHTADLGLEIFGDDLAQLFEHAAHAMVDQITDRHALNGIEQRPVMLSGEDWPDLMINWLRELLALWTIEDQLLQRARVETIEPFQLKAELFTDPYSAEHHRIRSEIKAVTYHRMTVEQRREKWMAVVIFDV